MFLFSGRTSQSRETSLRLELQRLRSSSFHLFPSFRLFLEQKVAEKGFQSLGVAALFVNLFFQCLAFSAVAFYNSC